MRAGATHFARADQIDFRDRMFEPTLVEVPPTIPLAQYRERGVPILDQGKVGWTCTGFALATLVHYLLRSRATNPDTTTRVSPYWLYEMARRFDDYPGSDYLGSSARGAMKGWHNSGACSLELWPHGNSHDKDRRLVGKCRDDAASRPLGAYLRVNHRDLAAMHCALAEVGILYATTKVHEGWLREVVGADGRIPLDRQTGKDFGGHALAIVAYDARGFWLQNSWGSRWGDQGFGHLSYDDWLRNGLDAWVARLGVPIELGDAAAAASLSAPTTAQRSRAQAMNKLRGHIINIGDEGHLEPNAVYSTSEDDLYTLFRHTLPQVTRGWEKRREFGRKKRILVYAGGGLTSLDESLQRGAELSSKLPRMGIYPIAVVWRLDYWRRVERTLSEVLAARRTVRPGSDMAFMADRMDDSLAAMARLYGGKTHWDDMKKTALDATAHRDGGMRLMLEYLAQLAREDRSVELHFVGHSAGAILLGAALQLLTTAGRIGKRPLRGRVVKGMDVPVTSCTLWAPACSVDFFHDTYFPAIADRRIRRFRLFTLTDAAERADSAGDYGKSLLYLISDAFEEKHREPGWEERGEPLVGMQRFLNEDDYPELLDLLRRRKEARWILAPNIEPEESGNHSAARRHAEFDDDFSTLLSTFSCIFNRPLTMAQLRAFEQRLGSHASG